MHALRPFRRFLIPTCLVHITWQCPRQPPERCPTAVRLGGVLGGNCEWPGPPGGCPGGRAAQAEALSFALRSCGTMTTTHKERCPYRSRESCHAKAVGKAQYYTRPQSLFTEYGSPSRTGQVGKAVLSSLLVSRKGQATALAVLAAQGWLRWSLRGSFVHVQAQSKAGSLQIEKAPCQHRCSSLVGVRSSNTKKANDLRGPAPMTLVVFWSRGEGTERGEGRCRCTQRSHIPLLSPPKKLEGPQTRGVANTRVSGLRFCPPSCARAGSERTNPVAALRAEAAPHPPTPECSPPAPHTLVAGQLPGDSGEEGLCCGRCACPS